MFDAILRRYPGYTLSSLLDEDAGELLPMIALVLGEESDAG